MIDSRALSRAPITCCVLGLLPAVALSQLAHFQFGLAFDCVQRFAKVVIYYLLFVALVDTLPRLKSFLFWLNRFVIVLTALALLHYHGIINIPSLDAFQQHDIDPETEEVRLLPRLCSTGLFNDPNDLCNIVVIGILISLFVMIELRQGFRRMLWLAPIGMYLYALKLTYSRGGLITLSAGVLTFVHARFGRKKTVFAAGLLLPAVLVFFGGRQTTVDVSSKEDTSQNRIQAWAEGLAVFRQAPLFGIGMDEYAEQFRMAAHNSFVHTYVELGFFGGTLFSGAFYTCLWGLLRLSRHDVVFHDQAASAVATLHPGHDLLVLGRFALPLATIHRSDLHDVRHCDGLPAERGSELLGARSQARRLLRDAAFEIQRCLAAYPDGLYEVDGPLALTIVGRVCRAPQLGAALPDRGRMVRLQTFLRISLLHSLMSNDCT